ncbi:TraX family protein [Paenibacillus xylanexedens]|uniref:TraX family protein n=1 Tax=Paenibacillus xylanexedens TaxID=528191 RepID=UPI003B027B43
MLKLIAVFTMLVDHIGYVFFPTTIIFTIIGRLSFPLFAWSIANGIRKTRSVKKYGTRILLLALISQIPYALLFKNNNLNVCFTLLFGIICIELLRNQINPILKYVGVTICLLVGEFLNFDYGIYGILTIVIFYCFHKKYHLILIFQTVITLASLEIYHYSVVQVYSLVASILIILLNSYDRFKINKYFYYTFFPGHIIILIILKKLLSNS